VDDLVVLAAKPLPQLRPPRHAPVQAQKRQVVSPFPEPEIELLKPSCSQPVLTSKNRLEVQK
jgi:hypothetical protein